RSAIPFSTALDGGGAIPFSAALDSGGDSVLSGARRWRPCSAASACQKAFVTNRVGDFGLLLGILGFFWITGSLEFRDLFKIANNWIPN
ncbi:proton-conducting transporter membrane subunit, partial [Klebsiella pneumoniae]|uniref:proton-conducting transporter transmembrane domain-containing protein n=1 Tax=Klebsiella pneumoniae TaxID=573 RepID=UPI003B597E43